MSNKIQIRRGTGAIGTVLDTGELAIKTDTKELAVGTAIASAALRISLWDEYGAQSILAATSADTPAALTIDEQRVVGRISSGNVAALTGANLWTILTGQAGADLAMNSKKITGVTDPASAQDAATKAYVDSIASGLSVHTAVAAATTDVLPACTYDNGVAGVGATLTANADGALPAQDGVTLSATDRILVKNQADAKQNGIYVVTHAGGAEDEFILTRATDMDEAGEIPHSFVFVSAGTTLKDTGWVCTNEPEASVPGTNNITLAQFSGAGYVSAGTGLTKTGNVIAATGGLADIAGLGMTKGNLIVGDADGDDWTALGVGSDTHVLTADAASANGIKWAAAPSGVTTFVDLTDTPANFTGSSLKVVRVNTGEDGNGTALEFVTFADTYLEGTPTEDLGTKAPTSEWAFDHNAGTGNSKHVPAAGDAGQFLAHNGAWATPAGTGANTALSNLVSVAINTALLPDAAAADDFGSATLPWKDLWFAGSSGTPATNNFKITGASTSGTRTITFPDITGTLITNNCTIDGGTLAA